MKPRNRFVLKCTALILSLALYACSDDASESSNPPSDAEPHPSNQPAAPSSATATAAVSPVRRAYFGDLHIHSSWSFDAYSFGVAAPPRDAYRYARGEAIDHVSGEPIQLRHGALDFIALTEHAEYLGFSEQKAKPSTADIQRMAQSMFTGTAIEGLVTEAVTKSTWQRLVDLANEHNDPGEFTALIGYEWTSSPAGVNLHRNVIFRDERVPERPFSALDSIRPEDLWAHMEVVRQSGTDVLAIPHNANISNGRMYDIVNSSGDPIDVLYAEVRMRNEPVSEVMQIKGQSEVHPALSPMDEFADFEVYERLITDPNDVNKAAGSYARDAFHKGLLFEERKGFNPFRFGMIGSTDSHNASSPVEEYNYTGKIGILDATPAKRIGIEVEPTLVATGLTLSVPEWGGAAGLAGVWAEENTREAIFDALKRKETFATSGPRIRLRIFSGWAFTDEDLRAQDRDLRGYAHGVPMGGELPSHGGGANSPTFLVWALKDPNSTQLQRLQIIKGWIEGGQSREQVIDIACADNLEPDPESLRCPDNGASVDLDTCAVDADRGDAQLSALWQDPDFDPNERAFYYARVLENPSCRNSSWQALQLGVERNPQQPATIQERAVTSPIWYRPEQG